MWILNLQIQIANATFKLKYFTHQNIYIKFQPSIMCLCIAFILITLFALIAIE